MFTRTLEFLFKVIRLIFNVSKDIDDQVWLQKLYNSKIFGKVFVKLFSSLNLGMTIYTLTSDGHLMPTSSLMSYESKTMEAFNPSLGDVVVDIGAYVGRYTLKASNKIGETGIVIAIEADPKAYRVLLQNIALNRAKNVYPFNIALSNYDGICRFYTGKPGFASLEKETFEFHHSNEVNEGEVVAVTCRTLDSLLDKLNVKRVDWIKVDVEGAEYEVLQGMIRVLEKNKHVKCIFEIHHADGVDKVKPQLKKMGFKTSEVGYAHILAFRNGNSRA